MALSILQGAPFWVWPVLAILVWFGLRATRERVVPVWPLYGLPLVGLLSVNAVAGLDVAALLWAGFTAAYLIGAAFGAYFQKTRVLAKCAGKVRLAGEWLTFAVLMLVFWMDFAGGVAAAIAPEVYEGSTFKLVFATIAGLAAGSFCGRALSTSRAAPGGLVSA